MNPRFVAITCDRSAAQEFAKMVRKDLITNTAEGTYIRKQACPDYKLRRIFTFSGVACGAGN